MANKRYLNSVFIDEPLTKESIEQLGTAYSVQELAIKLNYSQSTIHRMRKLGRFRASVKAGGVWHIVP